MKSLRFSSVKSVSFLCLCVCMEKGSGSFKTDLLILYGTSQFLPSCV